MPKMRMRFDALVLQCKQSREIINFAENITFFHGEVGTGKSSVARLIDFCLGGDAERTPAIVQELVSVGLSAELGEHIVLFERSLENSRRVTISWQDKNRRGATVSAPIQEGDQPVWRDAEDKPLHTVSDMIYYLLAVQPPKVRKNKIDPDADLVRLSFRDMMWYCYLPQEEMDSTFFHLDSAGGFKRPKSRDIMRYVLGFYSDRLSELEIDLDVLVNEQKTKYATAQQIQDFLARHGFGTVDDIQKKKDETEAQLRAAQDAYALIRENQRTDTHYADDLREKLRSMSEQLDQEEQSLRLLSDRLEQEESLKAELLTTKFKLARTGAAAMVLTGVKFQHCPNCGTPVDKRDVPDDHCYLCLQNPAIQSKDGTLAHTEAITDDLNNRIEELQDSIARHRNALKLQEKRVAEMRQEKLQLDNQLNQELANYDSANFSKFREAERNNATFEERLASLNRLLDLPEAVRLLKKEALDLTTRIVEFRKEIEREKATFAGSEQIREELEQAYLDTLVAVKFPGVNARDKVIIDTRNWEPKIQSYVDENRFQEYSSVGSGGKKTLLKVCFALALHKVAAQFDLPLPTFLLIDSPMKNIDPSVNEVNFRAFYDYLVNLAEGTLQNRQFILIDNVYPGLKSKDIKITDRKMMLTDENYPPLIPYYRE